MLNSELAALKLIALVNMAHSMQLEGIWEITS